MENDFIKTENLLEDNVELTLNIPNLLVQNLKGYLGSIWERYNKPLKLEKVVNIFNQQYCFQIPPYQRGYRWKANEQVKALLDDILDIKENDIYCLQPIVVSKINNSIYNLIDGQQRFTTLYLIFKVFGLSQKISIDYKTRRETKKFLEELTPANLAKNEKANPDFFFISEAYKKISKYKEDLDENARNSFREKVNKLAIIWYEVNKDNESNVFSSINSDKINLNDSDLFKAGYLDKLNQEPLTDIEKEKKISKFLIKWEYIEQSLRNDDFWRFIYGAGNEYDDKNRIELILDYIAKKKSDSSQFHTFNSLKKNFEDTWKNAISHFEKFYEWYNNSIFYNLIGCLIALQNNNSEKKFTIYTNLLEFYKSSECKIKKDFEKFLKNKIWKILLVRDYTSKTEEKIFKLDTISFDGTNEKLIKPVLLAFNIAIIHNNNKFNFKEFHNLSWDREHIHSQSQNIGNKMKLKYALAYFTGKTSAWTLADYPYKNNKNLYEKILNSYNEENEENGKEVLEEFQDTIDSLLNKANKDKQDMIDMHAIGNLALLDSITNREYQNAPFYVKRKIILNKYENGVFIPQGTLSTFSKHYTRSSANINFIEWTSEDQKNYFEKVDSTLREYYEPKKDSNEQ